MENKVKYRTKINRIGTIAKEILKTGNLILFSDTVDDRLTAFAFLHPVDELLGEVAAGDTLKVGESEFKIKSVGPTANAELKKNGHTVFLFAKEEANPNQIVLEGEAFPEIENGEIIEITTK